MERKEAIALLEDQHEFPGDFEFRVVVRPDAKDNVLGAIAAAAGEQGKVHAHREHPSKTGKFVALNVPVGVPTAETVLDIYSALKDVEGVMATM